MEKIDGRSKDILKDNINKLREIFPEVFTEDKIDFGKLQEILGENIEKGKEIYEFIWPGKSEALKLSQKTSTGTLRPDRDSSKNWNSTKNLYIEGDNLEVLKLLQKSYYKKIKMIYIDPPYNTGNDFVYKDDFKDNIKNYKRLTLQSMKANAETSGRYHSDWLNMMYPRLRLAKNLLRDDGVIFISIDDNEVHNLRKICDEIFGEENYRNTIIIRRGSKNLQAQFNNIDALNSGYEYILMYSKKSDTRFNKLYGYTNGVACGGWNNHWRGTDRPTMRYELFGIKPNKGQWRWSEERSIRAIENYKAMISDICDETPSQEQIDNWYLNKIHVLGVEKIDLLRLSNRKKPEHYIPPSNKKLLSDLWDDIKPNGSSYLLKVFDGIIFDNSKSIDLLIRMCVFILNKNDIVLDFFSGSATTAHAVMQLNAEDGGNRQFIMVQLPEPTDENSQAYKAGYKNICEIGKERIRRAGEKIKEENKDKEGIENLDIGFKVLELDSSNIKLWDNNPEDLELQLWDMVNPIKEDRSEQDIVYEIMLKYGIDLTMDIEEINIKGKKAYSVGLGYLIICLDDHITLDVVEEIGKLKPERAVFKDSGFLDDNVKINAVQILKKFDVEDFRSI